MNTSAEPVGGPDRRSWRVADADAFLPSLDRLFDSIDEALERRRDGAAGTDPRLVLLGLVSVLDEHGVVVRDLDRRLVDFPATGPGGESVLLCRIGAEPNIEWWHDPDAGFAGRRRLDDDPPW